MRDDAFAAYIDSAPGVTPQQIAEHLHVSVRTVRSYVHQTNEAMKGFAHIDLSRGCGYRLVIEDEARYTAWRVAPARPKDDAAMPQTPRQRIAYLMNDLLMRNDWITLEELADILFVSRSAVSNDLKRVERTLTEFGLTLEKRPHYGIRVAGSEFSRRLCLANLIMDGADGLDAPVDDAAPVPMPLPVHPLRLSSRSGGGYSKYSSLLDVISTCVQAVAREAGYQINAVAYQNLLVHIAVALVRIEENCYVPMETQHLASIKAQREYGLAQRMADELARETGIALPEEEVAYIAIHLAGKQMMDATPGDGEGLVISDEVWGVVSEMLERVWQAFRFDFREDLELRMGLARHIVPLSVRLRYRMNLKNPLLEDIRTRYALGYSMAIEGSAVLTEHYAAELSADEIGYLALSFALALERHKTATPKKTILMVCASGGGSARLLEYRCRQEFGAYIDRIVTCDVLNLSNVDFSDIDYVFTTVPISQPLPVPVREVQYFLDAEEVRGVKELLRESEASSCGSVPRFFDRSLFFPHLACASKQEVLDFLLDRVTQTREVSANFRELVWKREGTLATSFGNDVAMPHPLEASSDETFIAVGLLDNPVVWDEHGRSVRAVFLCSFSRRGGSELQAFFGLLADVLMSRRAIGTLVERQDWAALCEAFASISGEVGKLASDDG